MRARRKAGIGPRGRWARVVLRFAWPALLAGAVFAQSGPDREHRVKAVFLFNFAQFVEWPESAFDGPGDSLVVGILGENPFGEFLDEVVKGESVREHPIAVRRFRRPEDVKHSHVLFICAAEADRLDGLVSGFKGRGMLTVGESRDFLRHGGMIVLANEGGKVRLKINLEAVQEAGLSVSSKLLRLADVSGPRKE